MTPTPDPRLADIIRRHQQAFQRRARQTRYEKQQQRKESLAAAAQGHADAQFNLGFMHAKGRGVPPDYGLALKCTRIKARRQVPVQAQKNHLVSPNSRVSVGHWCDVSGWLFSPVVLLSHRGGRER